MGFINQETIAIFIAIITAGWGLYSDIKKRRYRASKEHAQDALKGIIAAIELLPEGGRKAKAKRLAKSISLYLDTESDLIFDLVKEVEKLLSDGKIEITGDDENSQALRASMAIKKARENRKIKKAMSAGNFLFVASTGFLISLIIMLSACSLRTKQNQDRLTNEMVWPGEQPRQSEIVVEWPQGVQADDVFTTSVQGFAISVAPYQEIEPTE